MASIGRSRRFKGEDAEIHAQPSKMFREVAGDTQVSLEPSMLRGEQSNTSIVYGDRLILKFFRRVGEASVPMWRWAASSPKKLPLPTCRLWRVF